MIKTPVCRQLGIEFPILSVGMGALAGPALAAAVSNAGGCGVVGRVSGAPPSDLGKRIHHLRQLTHKPFGVNVIIATPQDDLIDVCLEARVPLLVVFWGDPAPYVREAHRRGVKVYVQLGTVEEAVAAAEAGVDGIIAQGLEAGGHVKSTTALSTLLPEVVEAVSPVPVLAAGGIATGRGIVAALSLGAQGVSLGTRFLCSEEANAAQDYKARVVGSTAKDTIYTRLFNIGWDAPHRVLRNKAVTEWVAAGCPAPGQRPGEGTIIGTRPRGDTGEEVKIELERYSSRSYPLPGFQGDIEYSVLYAGESCSLIHDIKPASEIVRDLVREAEQAIEQLS
jgi:NAD(P)H-dependent flavin oxidoreductase YrpB (nitropropane dioxygenase family)